MIVKFLRNTSGATAIEYGLIAALVAVAAIAFLTAFGETMRNNVNDTSNQIERSVDE